MCVKMKLAILNIYFVTKWPICDVVIDYNRDIKITMMKNNSLYQHCL